MVWKAHGGLMVSAISSGLSGPGLSFGWGTWHFLGKTLYSHSASDPSPRCIDGHL